MAGTAAAVKPLVKVLRLRRFPILDLLRLEEALLRTDSGNWAIFNVGAASPAIVLGLSGKVRG